MAFSSVMILDGETRSALSVVRSLGGKGVPVIVGSNDPLGRSGFSKYSVSRFHYPDIEDHPESAHAVILAKIKSLRPEILMPIYDPGWELVYAHYNEYAQFTKIIPNPGRRLYKNLLDKAILAEYAEKSNIAIPRTYRPATRDAAIALSRELPYPVLLKSRTSAAGAGIKKASSPQELAELLEKETTVPIIQEFIEGEDLELTIFSIDGESIACNTYLSLRNAPLPYGPPVACATIVDEKLMETGIRFLKDLRYSGVAHIDFRRDRRDGQAKLLDFNARLAGTNEISTCSGIDFSLLQYLYASGDPLNRIFEFQIGLEFRWLLPGEIRYFVQTPHKLRTLIKYLKWRDVKTDIALRDPKPHFAMLLDALQRIHTKVFRYLRKK